MSDWNKYTNDDLSWDREVMHFENYSIFQTSSWAMFLQKKGWKCLRLQKNNKESRSYLQGFYKSYPFGIKIFWFPDWILGAYENSTGIINSIRKITGCKFFYIRLRSYRQKNISQISSIRDQFYIVDLPFDSGLTMKIDLLRPLEEIKAKLSKNWRRNLNRSNKIEYQIIQIRSAKTVFHVYEKFSKLKGLDMPFSYEDIAKLIDSFAERITIFATKTPDGIIHSIRGFVSYNNKSLDIFAAGDEFSRKYYMSYKLCWHQISFMHSIGIKEFDFNGVDPNGNLGVYNFKKGTGAELVELNGEFEAASFKCLLRPINFFLNLFRK